MSELSFQIPNSLSNPTKLPDDMKRTLTQLKSQNNRAAGVVKQPVTTGGKVPRGRKRGDMGSRPTTRGVAVRVYADRDSSREVEVTEDSKNYIGLQSGTAAPTTNDFAENEYGWFYDTAGSSMYFVINRAGTITNISPGTLGIAFTNISGSITDDQHGARGRVDSATNPLHANATTAQAGFFASTDKVTLSAHKVLLDAATSAETGSTIMMRDASSNAFAARFDASVSFRVGGVKVVGARGSAISDPSGGATVDSQARTAINSILSAMETHGLIET